MTTLEPPRGAPTSTLLEWIFDRINDHDVTSLRQVWTSATNLSFPDQTCVGEEEIAAYFTDKIATIEGFHLGVEAIAAAGEDGFVHWRMTGIHRGRVVGVDGTGRSIDLHGMDHFVIRDGQVASNTVVFDQLNFARQVGLLPPDRTRTDQLLKGAFNLKTKALEHLTRH